MRWIGVFLLLCASVRVDAQMAGGCFGCQAGGGAGGSSGAYSPSSTLTFTATPTYLAPGGTASSATEATVQGVVGAPGNISNLTANVSVAPGTGNSIAVTFRQNGADTALTCTISAAAKSCSDTTHSFAVALNDLIDIRAVATGTPGATQVVLLWATPGVQGPAGTPGQSVTVVTESAGVNCASGGFKLTSASGTSYVCHGNNGSNGANGTNGMNGTNGQSVTVVAESAGANCAYAGWKLTSASGVAYVCNGAPGSGSGASNATYCADATGSATTYTCPSPTPNITSLSGAIVVFTPQTTNTGAATLSVAGLGAKNLKQSDGTVDLGAGALLGGNTYIFVYDGTVLRQQAGCAADGTTTLCNGGKIQINTTNYPSIYTERGETGMGVSPLHTPWIALTSGTGAAYAACPATTIGTLVANETFLYIQFHATNTSTTPTLNVCGLSSGAVITKLDGTALGTGDVKAATYRMNWDGTSWRAAEAGLASSSSSSAAPFSVCFNFRATAAGVSSSIPTGGDGACTYVLDGSSTGTNAQYPTTRTVNGSSVTFGWESGQGGLTVRDRVAVGTNGADVRLSGTQLIANGSTPAVFRVDLPVAGNYRWRLAAGDPGSSDCSENAVVEDTTSAIKTYSGVSIASSAIPGKAMDANGIVWDSPWQNGNATGEKLITSGTWAYGTWATTIFRFSMGATGTGNSCLNHIEVEAVGAGGGTGTVTTISSGNLSPIFNVSVANPTTTPAFSFSLLNAAQNSVLAGPATGGAGAPSYQTAPTISAANMTNFPSLPYLPIGGGTLTGNLLFTDATYDIGASGATRPRNLYLSGQVVAPGGFSGGTTFSASGGESATPTTPSADTLFFSSVNHVPQFTKLGNSTIDATMAVPALGATSHQWVDYIPTTGIPHTSQPAASDISGLNATAVGLGSVTNDAQTKAAIMPNTAPSAGQIPAGNTGGTAYAAVSVSGDATLASTGAITVKGVNGVPLCTGFSPTTGQALEYTTASSPNPCYTAATLAQTIASGTASLGTTSIAGNTCASAVTVAAVGVVTTDAISWTPNADISGITGYGVASTDGLIIFPYPTLGNVNFKVCNATASAITPGAVMLNWRVGR